MSNIEKQYFLYLESTTEEERAYDESFKELEQEYCEYVLDKQEQELKAIFGDTD